MKKTVWKFEVVSDDGGRPGIGEFGEYRVLAPLGTKIISVIDQWEHVVVYGEVPEAEALREYIRVYVLGTGKPFDVPDTARFLGTVKNGNYVWHVYV